MEGFLLVLGIIASVVTIIAGIFAIVQGIHWWRNRHSDKPQVKRGVTWASLGKRVTWASLGEEDNSETEVDVEQPEAETPLMNSKVSPNGIELALEKVEAHNPNNLYTGSPNATKPMTVKWTVTNYSEDSIWLRKVFVMDTLRQKPAPDLRRSVEIKPGEQNAHDETIELTMPQCLWKAGYDNRTVNELLIDGVSITIEWADRHDGAASNQLEVAIKD